MPATVSGVLTGDDELTLAAACSWAPRLACVARRVRDRDADRPIPQECAIEGPAVYPMNAPATAPTGPKTTAPDTAPRAASPARFCALASNEINDPAISAATKSFFIAVPSSALQGARGSEIAAARRCRLLPLIQIRDSKSPRPVSRRGLNACDAVDMPVICPTCQIF